MICNISVPLQNVSAKLAKNDLKANSLIDTVWKWLKVIPGFKTNTYILGNYWLASIECLLACVWIMDWKAVSLATGGMLGETANILMCFHRQKSF